MSIRVIDTVCPQAILTVMVTVFPSYGMLCVTNIWSRNRNSAWFLFRIERGIRWWLFHVATNHTFCTGLLSWKNCRFCKKIGLWLLITGSDIDLGSKIALPIASARQEQSAVFFAKLHDAYRLHVPLLKRLPEGESEGFWNRNVQITGTIWCSSTTPPLTYSQFNFERNETLLLHLDEVW